MHTLQHIIFISLYFVIETLITMDIGQFFTKSKKTNHLTQQLVNTSIIVT
jgi:hypothetical protein